MEHKNSSKSWLILGAVFILALFIFAYLIKFQIINITGATYVLISAVFGAGGAIFLIIGIISAIIEKFRK